MTSASETTVDLAHEPDFYVGAMLVSPSACLVRCGEAAERVEPRVMEVLILLARNAGRTVTRDELIDACWGRRIVSDDAVNRVLARVRALGRSLSPPPFVLETIPKVGFRLVAAGAGRARPPSVGDQPPALGRHRVLTTAGLALAVLALAGVLAWRFIPQAPARPPGHNGRIDVMPFEAASSDPELQKVAADIPQSVVRILASAGVPVAKRQAARDAAEGPAELRVAGTVQLENANYVVNAQILDQATGQVLWTNRFVRTPRELQAEPDQEPSKIAGVLHCALQDRSSARAPLSTEAFGLLMNACSAWSSGEGGSERMLALTRRLVTAAPLFANAHAMNSIAAAYAAEDAEEHAPSEATALHAESKASAEQALKLYPRTPEAYSGLALNEGVLGARLNQNRLLEEQDLLKGLKLDPELTSLRNEYGALLRSTGRINEAIEFIRATSDAGDPWQRTDSRYAMLLASSGDLAGAGAALKAMRASSRISTGDVPLAIAFWWEDPKVALPKIRALAAEEAPQTPREKVDCFVTYLTQLDARRAKGVRGLPETCRGGSANWRVRMLAREGDVDGAFAALKLPISGGTLLLYYPEMKAVRRDPRFWPFAKSVGLTDYWLKSGHWPDFCAEPDLPYDCRKAAAR